MSIDKFDLQSPDLVHENFEKLAALFPNCVTESAEGKAIDFDLLKQELSHAVIDGSRERYRLEWPGKREAIVTANLPTTKTLRPKREDSVDFDNTENLYIEGDNLEVLKILQESYFGKIKMIYIDPPYNTGNDFVYRDNFTGDKEEELFESGQIDEYNRRLVANPEASGRYHSDWLSMMYPRLKLARNLLTEEGVIFISIDDNEVHNLRKMCDEVFGDGNFVACLPTIMNLKGNNDQFGFAGTHEFTIVYCKKRDSVEDLNGIPLDENDYTEYSEKDAIGSYKQGATLMRTGEAGYREKRPKGYYPIYVNENLTRLSVERMSEKDYEIYPKTKEGKDMSWRRSPSNLRETAYEFIIKKTINGISFYKKQRLEEDIRIGKKAKTLFYKPEYSSGNGTDALKGLFNNRIFDNPKPIPLLKDFISVGSNKDDIILDFFSGSATTAHAIMQLNAEDGGNRKYIMVQLPEQIENGEYKNICEIGKERIRRAASKIKEEKRANAEKDGMFSDFEDTQDYGFRVYRLADSNMQDIYYRPQDYKQETLDLFADNIKPDRSSDDLLAQVMLDWGLPLSYRIEQVAINDKQVFKVAQDSLFACFDKGIDEAFAKEIAKEKPLRIVFRDNGFANDTAKTNVQQLLKQLSPETEMKVI
jgi:adenine-specific DNA-methyltransferase